MSKLSDFLIPVDTYTQEYLDGSLATRDVSIEWLDLNKIEIADLYPYATNASIATAAFAKNASLNLYVQKTGDTMTGSLNLDASLLLQGGIIFDGGGGLHDIGGQVNIVVNGAGSSGRAAIADFPLTY